MRERGIYVCLVAFTERDVIALKNYGIFIIKKL